MDENVENTVVLKNMELGEGRDEEEKLEMGKHMGVGEEEG